MKNKSEKMKDEQSAKFKKDGKVVVKKPLTGRI